MAIDHRVWLVGEERRLLETRQGTLLAKLEQSRAAANRARIELARINGELARVQLELQRLDRTAARQAAR